MSDTSIREAIGRLSAAISADPSKARAKNASASARITEGLKCEVTGPRGERAVTDMPPAMGGDATGPNPGWLLRAAMASCTATVVAMRAAKLGIVLSTLEVKVESESDNRGLLGLDERISAGLETLRTTVRVGGNAESQSLRELVAWADAHSPVGCTVRRAPACSLEIEVV
jgi:uncharacterized OsmC-like protein